MAEAFILKLLVLWRSQLEKRSASVAYVEILLLPVGILQVGIDINY
jgi:hypothetical protein